KPDVSRRPGLHASARRGSDRSRFARMCGANDAVHCCQRGTLERGYWALGKDSFFDFMRKSLKSGELKGVIERRGMKSTALALASVAALLCSIVESASAGTITLDVGPSFRPGSAFTDNDIAAVLLHNPPGVMGDVVRLFGDSRIYPASDSPRIVVKGSFSAGAGDLFSIIYDFTVDLR